jgi:hypothetical protein
VNIEPHLELRQRSRDMLENPRRWPCGFYLPMKIRTDGTVDAGYAVTADYPTIVLKGYPSSRGLLVQLACEDPELAPPGIEDFKALYATHVVARYDTIDEMLDNGWEID